MRKATKQHFLVIFKIIKDVQILMMVYIQNVFIGHTYAEPNED